MSASTLSLDYRSILSNCNIACRKIILIFSQILKKLSRSVTTRIPRIFGQNRINENLNIGRINGNRNVDINTNNNIHSNYNNNNNNSYNNNDNNNINNNNNIDDNNNNINNNNNDNNNNNNDNNNNNNDNNNNNNNNDSITSSQNIGTMQNLIILKNRIILYIIKRFNSTSLNLQNRLNASIKTVFTILINSNTQIRKILILILRIISSRR